MSPTLLLIVVPARAGSKGLPRKNARSLAGEPLLAWTAEAVRRAGLAHAHCVLSTDDEEIAEIGRRAGLQVPFLRPAELATDRASPESVALHAIAWMERAHNAVPDAVMWLQPTSPFRPPQAILEAESLLAREPELDGVLGVKVLHRSLATLFRIDARKRLVPLAGKDELRARRQEIDPLYTPNGALYLVRTRALRAGEGFFPGRCGAIVMDAIASVDIDDETDWRVAESIAAAGLSWRGRL